MMAIPVDLCFGAFLGSQGDGYWNNDTNPITGLKLVGGSKAGNRALADAVAASQFGERGTLRPALAGLGLLRLGQFPMRCPRFCARLRP
jgi:hypothetical protein